LEYYTPELAFTEAGCTPVPGGVSLGAPLASPPGTDLTSPGVVSFVEVVVAVLVVFGIGVGVVTGVVGTVVLVSFPVLVVAFAVVFVTFAVGFVSFTV